MRHRATPSKGAGTLAVMAAQPEQPRHPRAPRALVRALVGVTASLSLIVAAISAYAYVGYTQAQNSIRLIPDVPSSSAGAQTPDFGPCVDDVCNYLILGSDSRAGLTADEQNQFGTDEDIGGSNRSDVIMLVHTDPRLRKAIVLSFPRDLWVDIPGRGFDKINSAFSGGLEGGGAQLVAKTVEELSGLKINHVLYVDLAGFQGIVQALGGVTMCIPAAMTDPLTGLDVQAGCQTLDGYQALAYVRTRHQPCDLVPDFARISRQQQFLRAVLNRLLSPSEIAKAPSLIRPVARNLVTTKGFDLADVIYLVKQLEGISTGAVEFRAVPAVGGFEGTLSVLYPDPVAEQIFARIRKGEPLGNLGVDLAGTAPSEANILVPVVDHGSGGTAEEVETVLSDAGFDISPGIVDYVTYGSDVKGSVIAYKAGNQSEAEVVQKYFPNLQLLEVPASALRGSPVAVFIAGGFHLEPVGSGTPTTDCIAPDA
jgi:LCP family protein required for cell wall assembly